VRNPIDMSATPASYRLAPPELGADTEEVRRWLLHEGELDGCAAPVAQGA
jgi:crotonobetainyl-CoA:carnitine CoA-transferase CaiB-like acyl-CoA transferase